MLSEGRVTPERSIIVSTRRGGVPAASEKKETAMFRAASLLAGGTALLMTALLGAATSSPVADAAMRGDRDAVRALLKQGGDVSAAHGDGMTPLHWAAERGDTAMAEM